MQDSKNAKTGLSNLKVIKRNKQQTEFTPSKITTAISKAFIDVMGNEVLGSTSMHQAIVDLTNRVVAALAKNFPNGGFVTIEDIQDAVEKELMESGYSKVAKAYILYRNERDKSRKASEGIEPDSKIAEISVVMPDGKVEPFPEDRVISVINEACAELSGVDPQAVYTSTKSAAFDGMKIEDLSTALIMSARTMIESDPNYNYVAARLLLDQVRQNVFETLGLNQLATKDEYKANYPEAFKKAIQFGVERDILNPEMLEFDLEQLGQALVLERDYQFTFLGMQTLSDRYFLRDDQALFELPQVFFMRVAMGLSLNEKDKNKTAVEFYNLMSSFDYMASTPTLFNSGTKRSQLSSCYLTNVPDHLEGIYNAIKDNALLSKYAGGLGNDWTPVRGLGAYIKGTNGESQGVVPFLKVVNDTAVAVNQGGKRKGAVCSYLETWHIDIEEFLELRKNTGDDRRRTHDMNTANWIPDLFMTRVMEDGTWTLFSPNEVPELHDLYGKAFEEKYTEYEQAAASGQLRKHKVLKAKDLWRKMISMLFETGHPWITFKDPCNVRSPQQHAGVVHSSNLCTEITLNTKAGEEVAVCNLGSVNVPQHIMEDGSIDEERLKSTIQTAMRLLDNVIDINYYPIETARNSNLRHRPVGLGIMGFQDALYKKRIPYASEEAVEFADECMELVSYYAIEASSELAKERGCYESYKGSLWSQGILPIDSLELLEQSRSGEYLDVNKTQRLDWDSLREKVQGQGMRNSNVMAIAPTATIANITGVSQSIEPTYQNLFVKSNLSGEFTVVNKYLASDLKKLGLWDVSMVHDLKYFEGSVQNIDRVPDELKELYKTAFEVEPKWLVDANSRRQKWVDQAISLNLYVSEPSGKKLDLIYKMAWIRGLKTTYYLRSMAATSTEKSTISDGRLNAVSNKIEAPEPPATTAPKACSILEPDCEACQ